MTSKPVPNVTYTSSAMSNSTAANILSYITTKLPNEVPTHLGTAYGWTFQADPAVPENEVDYLASTRTAYCTSSTYLWLQQNSGRNSVVAAMQLASREAEKMPASKMRFSYASLAPSNRRTAMAGLIETFTGEINGLIQTVVTSQPTDVQAEVIIKRYGKLKADLAELKESIESAEAMLATLDDVIQNKLEGN